MTQTQRTRKNKKRPLHPTGRLIKQLRKASGYTQEEIKNILGFQATSAISKIESKDFIPDLLRLQKLLSLISPSAEQKKKILDYYGYSESELPEKHEFVASLKSKAEKGDILSALHTLFYLHVYEQDFTGVTETVQELYQKNFYIPQSVRSCSRELEMILREIFSCRRMLAQGILSQQVLPLEEALQRAEMAYQLLTLIYERYKKKLTEDAHLFLALLRLHISFCAENTYFGMMQLEKIPRSELFEPSQFEKRSEFSLPRTQDVLEEIESRFPEYNLQDVRQMALFIERESLHLLYQQCEQSELNLIKAYLESLKVDLDGQAQATDWIQALDKNTNEAVFKDIYAQVFENKDQNSKNWKATFQRFREILKAHQKVSNWDGSTAQTAMVNTFLSYPLLLTRLGHLNWAQDILDLLYLQLTVADTHYRWTHNMALCKAMQYIHNLQFNLRRVSDDKIKEAESLLEDMIVMLEKAIADLKHVKSLNGPKNLHQIFINEPAFYLSLLHASRHYQFKKLDSVKRMMKLFNEQLALTGA